MEPGIPVQRTAARRSDICIVEMAISMMKSGKAAGAVVEMIRTEGDTGTIIICNIALLNCSIRTDWGQSCIVCLYKVNGDALDRGNYRGLKLAEQAMTMPEDCR